MKNLVIIRHAKSSWDDSFLRDFDRPLNKRGEQDAPRMGKRLKEKQLTPDLLLSSPAKRALTTCEKIAEALYYPHEKIKTEKDLYHAEDGEILQVVKKIDDQYNVVLIFGHNPGLTDFVNRLTNAFIENIPTCGVAACSLKINSWNEAAWKTGELNFFDFPKNQP